MRQPFKLLTALFKLLLPLCIVCSTLLTGCGTALPSVKPFKMDIQQGNVVTSKMLLQLRPGMTKSQVRFIMGTPLMVDSFHKDRWDYFYQMRQAGKIVEQRRVILDFEKDLLSKVRGDVVPEGTSGAGSAADASTTASGKSIEPVAKEEGVLDKLKFWKADEKTAVKPVIAKPSVASAEAAAKLKAEEKNQPEKSWTDKLKFWKKDAPKTAPLEAPAATMPSATLPDVPVVDASETAQDAPSVLAVPIGIALPDVDAPVTEAPPEEAVKIEPIKVEPAPVKAEPAKPMPTPVPRPAPLPAPVKAAPAIKRDEPLIFRMDRNLDMRNLEAAPNQAVPAAAKPKKVESEPLPAETEPSFFDRMLEKIGF